LFLKFLYNILNIILKEQNPQKALNYVKEVVHNLQENKIDLDKLVITKSISKDPEEYKGIQPHIELVKRLRKRDLASAPIVGERIGFVIIKGLQNISERAEDPEYVKKHGLKIDSKYYIENQLLPPLERVFEAIGIGKDELFRVGKQVLINEVLNNKTQNKVESILNHLTDLYVINVIKLITTYL
jgi:DNA polymerase delta subunit 1